MFITLTERTGTTNKQRIIGAVQSRDEALAFITNHPDYKRHSIRSWQDDNTAIAGNSTFTITHIN